MQTIILVDGSVTAKQYEQVRLDAIREGLDPIVCRFSIEKYGSECFIITGDLLVRVFFTEDTVGFEDHVAERITKWLDYKDASLFAVIATETTHFHDNLFSFSGLMQHFDQDFQYWVVREDGQLEAC